MLSRLVARLQWMDSQLNSPSNAFPRMFHSFTGSYFLQLFFHQHKHFYCLKAKDLRATLQQEMLFFPANLKVTPPGGGLPNGNLVL